MRISIWDRSQGFITTWQWWLIGSTAFMSRAWLASSLSRRSWQASGGNVRIAQLQQTQRTEGQERMRDSNQNVLGSIDGTSDVKSGQQ